MMHPSRSPEAFASGRAGVHDGRECAVPAARRRATRSPAAAPVRSPGGGEPAPLAPVRGPSAQLLAVVLLAVALNANTLANGWALDDAPIITANPAVQAGLRGLPRIFASDAYAGYYASLGAGDLLAGGRYRPLSIATFAVEHELFGDSPAVGHAGNVALYALTVAVLLVLLRRHVLPRDADAAFLAALLFTVHPLHTEVVANVKSRDEILSLLFILVALLLVLRHAEAPRPRTLVLAALSAGAALLSKEWGVVLVALVPLSLWLFTKTGAASIARRTAPFAALTGVYLVLRFRTTAGLASTRPPDLLTDPFLHATPAEAVGTKLFALLDYVRLLVWPARLSADYSFAAIPYRSPGDPLVVFSIALYLAIVVLGIAAARKRSPLAFAAAFYLFPLVLVSNFLFPIGAVLGERLVYHSSVGFCLAAGVGLLAALRRAFEPGPARRAAFLGVAAVLVVVAGGRTVTRNADWKDDATLFLHDVAVVPRSVLANGNASAACVVRAEGADGEAREALLRRGAAYAETALALHPGYVDGWFDLGAARYGLGDVDGAARAWNEARRLFPGHADLPERDRALAAGYLARAQARYRAGDVTGAGEELEKGRRYAPESPELAYWSGGVKRAQGDLQGARAAWEAAAARAPRNADLLGQLGELYLTMGEKERAAEVLERALALRPGDPALGKLLDQARKGR